MQKNKVLIIRFSSFGDILQGLTVPRIIKQNYSDSTIHWLTRSDFTNLVRINADVDEVISFDRKNGLWGLILLAFKLRKEKYTHLYDAHNNVRSGIINFILRFPYLFNSPKFLQRSKDRWKRILLFKFGINHFPKPFKGRVSFENPLKKWDLNFEEGLTTVRFQFDEKTTTQVNLHLEKIKTKNWITIVPSAAWEMKRWPVSHFEKLFHLLGKDFTFVLLGGPGDTFIAEMAQKFPLNSLNLAGKLSLVESSYLVTQSQWIISNDTGLLHVADLAGIHGLSLQGPTAFGFTTHPHLKTIEVDLACRPCSKDGSGKCSQVVYQKCMVDITPEALAKETLAYFNS